MSEFPVSGLLPKAELQADEFVKQNPAFDGRGIVVAIFDTGVDPQTEGLITTPDGKPKIIDFIDTAGGGDIDTSTVVRVAATDGKYSIRGITGRQLQLGPRKCPSNEFHIGVKALFDAFPEDLVERLKAERGKSRNVEWANELARIEAEQATLTTKDAQQKLEYENRVALLQALQKQHATDVGPLCDCVVYHDGSAWRAIVDTSERGDMTDGPAMTSYFVERQCRRFGNRDFMNFTVNIYNNGNTLSLVTPAGAHGTHVAGIVGAYYPNQPELNGVAPGCQLISIKIGDSRIGSMETGVGVLRGLQAALERGAHVINMSYGEAAARCAGSRLSEALDTLVQQHNIVFVSRFARACGGVLFSVLDLTCHAQCW
jgi:tripeptidyl-peptidase-2